MYSAMSHKWRTRDDQVELPQFLPFWALMLAGRDECDLVNMKTHMEEYTCFNPKAKHHGEISFGSTTNLVMPFVCNDCDLAAGDLLVLPFNGGLPEICAEFFLPITRRL